MATSKAPDAFRTIGELAEELGVAQHILRYWEGKFPQLRPLQRAGNRRYYRPADADLARRIHRLLNQEGYTIRGVQKMLANGQSAAGAPQPSSESDVPAIPLPPPANADERPAISAADLRAVRERLVDALDD